MVSEAQRDLEAMDNGPDIPITDWIVNFVAEQFTTDDTKTTDQLRRRMMKMGLIQKIQKRPKSFATINRREPREVMGLELSSLALFINLKIFKIPFQFCIMTPMKSIAHRKELVLLIMRRCRFKI